MIILLVIIIELSYFIFVRLPTFWSHFYLYLMCVSLLMNLNRLDSTFSRIAEREENALLVKRKLLDNNTSHLYSYDTTVTTDYDDHLSHVVEVNVVNHLIKLLVWADNVWRGYPHGSHHPLQVRIIQPLVSIIYPIHTP